MVSVRPSTCAANQVTILKCIASECRVDGRSSHDYRRIVATFAQSERGCITVCLGDTRVVAKVTHEIVEPHSQRPAEGQLQVNLEVPGLDGWGTGRLDEEGLKAQRALERCFKESKCLDLESLCIVPGERVFLIRVMVHVVNHDGNVIDAAGLAVVLSLADYRRPDVSLVDGRVKVGEGDPVPLTLLFYPIIQTVGLVEGKYLLTDLTSSEESVVPCRVVLAMNVKREVCCLLTVGGVLIEPSQLLNCARQASRKVKPLSKMVMSAIANRGVDTGDKLPEFIQDNDDIADEVNGGSDEGEVSSNSDMDVASDMDISDASGPVNPYKLAEVRPETLDQVSAGLRMLRAETEGVDNPNWYDEDEPPLLTYLD